MKPLSWYRELADPRKRKTCGCFLVEGQRAIGQIFATVPSAVEEILVTGKARDVAGSFKCPVRLLTDRQFSSICVSRTPQGIAAVVRSPDDIYDDRLPEAIGEKLLILEGIQDPGNVGTLIRSAAAFDFDGIILNDECADPLSAKAVQASAGSVLAVWLRRTDHYLDLTRSLKDRDFTLFAAAMDGTSMTGSRASGPLAVMLGSEGSGLTLSLLEIADAKISIPMSRAKAESLNVAVAGGIVMHHFAQELS